MKYKAVVFDLDGVICSTDKYHYWAWQCIADKIGVEFDKQINHRLRGIGRMESLDIILENHDEELSIAHKLDYAKQKNSLYIEMLEDMSSHDLTDDVRNTLETLRKLGFKLAIGSSSRNAKLILEKIGLGDFFDTISDGTNISRSKPHPEVFLTACSALNLEPKDCIVIEDAKSGVDAALAGGMDCAAIGNASSYNKATYSLQKLSDILQYLV